MGVVKQKATENRGLACYKRDDLRAELLVQIAYLFYRYGIHPKRDKSNWTDSVQSLASQLLAEHKLPFLQSTLHQSPWAVVVDLLLEFHPDFRLASQASKGQTGTNNNKALITLNLIDAIRKEANCSHEDACGIIIDHPDSAGKPSLSGNLERIITAYRVEYPPPSALSQRAVEMRKLGKLAEQAYVFTISDLKSEVRNLLISMPERSADVQQIGYLVDRHRIEADSTIQTGLANAVSEAGGTQHTESPKPDVVSDEAVPQPASSTFTCVDCGTTVHFQGYFAHRCTPHETSNRRETSARHCNDCGTTVTFYGYPKVERRRAESPKPTVASLLFDYQSKANKKHRASAGLHVNE